MTEEQKEILRQKGIKEDFENYYVTEEGIVFAPIKDKNENIIVTAKQQYESYLNPSNTQLTEVEKQAELINNLILDNLNMQMQIDELITSSLGGN